MTSLRAAILANLYQSSGLVPLPRKERDSGCGTRSQPSERAIFGPKSRTPLVELPGRVVRQLHFQSMDLMRVGQDREQAAIPAVLARPRSVLKNTGLKRNTTQAQYSVFPKSGQHWATPPSSRSGRTRRPRCYFMVDWQWRRITISGAVKPPSEELAEAGENCAKRRVERNGLLGRAPSPSGSAWILCSR